MSVCLACNRALSIVELCGTKPDGEPEDMCAYCRAKAMEKFTLLDEIHMFEHLEDVTKWYSGFYQTRATDY